MNSAGAVDMCLHIGDRLPAQCALCFSASMPFIPSLTHIVDRDEKKGAECRRAVSSGVSSAAAVHCAEPRLAQRG